MTALSVRQQIIGMLSRTRFARYDLSEETIEELSKEAGVRPEVLLESKQLYLRQAALLGKEKAPYIMEKIRRTTYDYISVTIEIPPQAKQYAEAFALKRGVSLSIFSRSIIHEYLRGSWEPLQIHHRWRIEGQIHVGGLTKSTKTSRLKIQLSEGAKEALVRRAECCAATMTDIIKTLFVDTFEGNFAQPGTIKYVTRRQMFDRMEQYYIPPMPEAE